MGYTYEYNWDGKLTTAKPDELQGPQISFKYDPMGNRIFQSQKEASSTTASKYIIDTVGDLPVILLELDPYDSDAIKKSNIYAGPQIVCTYTDNTPTSKYFYLSDRLGSVRMIINTDADVLNTYTYRPFGQMLDSYLAQSGSFDNNFKFTGQWYDEPIDQYYLRARQYNPQLMRFTSRDPVFGKFEQPLSIQKYIYCLNEPINKWDPWGLESVALFGDNERNTSARQNAAGDFDWSFSIRNSLSASFYLGLLKDLGVVIDDVYILDHGYVGNSPIGRQEIGNEPLLASSEEWKKIASTVEKDGAIHLRGCSVASGSAGKEYISNLAMLGQRKVDAFDDLVVYRGSFPGPNYYSSGGLWQATPSGEINLIRKGSAWNQYNPFSSW